ncbi:MULTISPECIES: hypothetical protein [unclassified Carboxylicivirga]|uniref:hypothetical protein n=1 Tax=Carboxylicivirga TaxID=1628153 RepID=UPI003D352244
MVQNKKHYLIWPKEEAQAPSPRSTQERINTVEHLRRKSPHLITEVKRSLPNRTLRWHQRILLSKDYPIKNGQQPQTKGCIVWTDYCIQTLPLLLYLCSIKPDTSFKTIQQSFFANEDLTQPQWKQIIDYIQKNGDNENALTTDALDGWYDEVNITKLRPASYHAFYRWFGTALKDVGYQAFDIFMERRDGRIAWQGAIDAHLATYTQLPAALMKIIVQEHLRPLLVFE